MNHFYSIDATEKTITKYDMAKIINTGKNEYTVVSQKTQKPMGTYSTYLEAQKKLIDLVHRLQK